MMRLFINAAVVGAIALSIPTQAIARDPGVNQPGAVGNTGVGRDPGVNQPGAVGNGTPGNRGGSVNRAGRR